VSKNRGCRKIEGVESFRLSTIVLRAPGPPVPVAHSLAVDWRVPSPSSGLALPPTGNWPAGRAPTVPSPPRPGGPPPRTQDARTGGRGMPGRSHRGPSAWPGPSRLVVPLPTRPLRLGRRRSFRLPAGRRWPGGFSPHYILSDSTWAEKCPATLKVAKKLPWGRGLLCKWYVHAFLSIQSGPVFGTFRPQFLT
jgi:hypothetical protein